MRHQKRNYERLRELASRPPPDTLHEIICMTPPISPLPMPQELEVPERALRSVRNYYVGAFESGMWTREGWNIKDPEGASYQLLVDLNNACMSACLLFDMGKGYEAQRTLSRAMAGIQAIIQAENPALLMQLFNCGRSFYFYKRLEIVHQLLWYLVQMVEIVLGNEHPLYVIFRNIKVEDFTYGGLISRLLGCVADSFHCAMGSTHRITVFAECLWHSENYLDSISKLQALKEQCYNEPSSGQVAAREVHSTLASCLAQGSRYEEAEEQASHIIRMLDGTELSEDTAEQYVGALEVLHNCKTHTGKTNLSRSDLCKAYSKCATMHGENSSDAMMYLLRLEEKLLEWDEPEEAAKIHEQLAQLLLSED